MNRLKQLWTLAFAAGSVAAAASASADSFQLLTYNVRGIPFSPPFFNEDRSTEMATIAELTEDFHEPPAPTSIVVMQEVFSQDYYDTLTDPNTVTYPHITPKDEGTITLPPPLPPEKLGDGLIRMSDVPFTDFTRTQWNDCFGTLGQNGSDCDTNKGYSFAQHELEPGVFVDVYNLHSDAGQDPNSIDARASNLRQLGDDILMNSVEAGNAVIVAGDFNSLYTRSTDVIRELVDPSMGPGLTDVWAELVFGPANPGDADGLPDINGELDAGCDIDPSGAMCEQIDKILYRGSALLDLAATSYDGDAFGDNETLSDHRQIAAVFDYTVIPEPTTAALLFSGLFGLGLRARRADR
ncbi:MAG: endonuclease/exonuclease/phosphatase family protein [Myxococcota bacterium]|nr:endonuclease/exonuclease/phosphatase family protein [Myxococcota bacterium]